MCGGLKLHACVFRWHELAVWNSLFPTLSLQKKMLGQSVFDQVLRKLDLLERDYFGLLYEDDHKTMVNWVLTSCVCAGERFAGCYIYIHVCCMYVHACSRGLGACLPRNFNCFGFALLLNKCSMEYTVDREILAFSFSLDKFPHVQFLPPATASPTFTNFRA